MVDVRESETGGKPPNTPSLSSSRLGLGECVLCRFLSGLVLDDLMIDVWESETGGEPSDASSLGSSRLGVGE